MNSELLYTCDTRLDRPDGTSPVASICVQYPSSKSYSYMSFSRSVPLYPPNVYMQPEYMAHAWKYLRGGGREERVTQRASSGTYRGDGTAPESDSLVHVYVSRLHSKKSFMRCRVR